MEEILIECSPGVSGDMLLGAFYDLGVPKDEIEKKLACFGLENLYNLNFRESQNCSIRGIKVDVCLLYTSPSPRDATLSRMPSSA